MEVRVIFNVRVFRRVLATDRALYHVLFIIIANGSLYTLPNQGIGVSVQSSPETAVVT